MANLDTLGHPLMLQEVRNQRVYPSGRPSGKNEGQMNDVDDCWVVATIMAALASDSKAPRPTITEFRKAAGDPDDGIRDGGTVDEVHKGAVGCFAYLKPRKMEGWTWENALAELKKLRAISFMVNSKKLNPNYGFTGWHQVLIFHQTGVGLYIANPLAPNGSAPIRISTAEAKAAIESYGNGKCYGEIFPSEAEAKLLRIAAGLDPKPTPPPPPEPPLEPQIDTVPKAAYDAVVAERDALKAKLAQIHDLSA